MSISTIVTTAGSAAANAYVDLTTANQYHIDRPAADDVWLNATDAQKQAGILWATKLLDRLVAWTGARVDYTQALEWPRYGTYYRNGDYIPSDVIPEDLQWATAEFARQLLTEDLAESGADVERLGLKSFSGGGISLSFRSSAFPMVIPNAVYLLMPDSWFARSRSVVELLRG